MITETCLKTEISTTICGGNLRANGNFRDHARMPGCSRHVMWTVVCHGLVRIKMALDRRVPRANLGRVTVRKSLEVTREQVLSFRQRAGALTERLAPGAES